MRRFAISGVTFAGNLGGQAMLLSTLQEVRRTERNVQFRVLSVFPAEDAELCKDEDVDIVDASPLRLVCVYLPLSIVMWPISRFALTRRLLRRITYFRRLSESDMLFDMSGIAFADGRGVPLLAYNVACSLPAIALGVPVVKLSQALGPFRTLLNRSLARFVLGRCRQVYARGRETLANLQEIGISRSELQPDITFALEVPDARRLAARSRLDGLGLGPRLLGIAPSQVMEHYCDAAGVNLPSVLVAAATWAWDRGWDVLIVAHSQGRPGSKNDDLPLCGALERACLGRARLIDRFTDAVEARAVIGCSRVFVGCRFHAVVGALSMGVPALALGWSHKYAELLREFDLERFAIDASAISTASLVESLDAVEREHASIVAHVATTAGHLAAAVRVSYTQLLRQHG